MKIALCMGIWRQKIPNRGYKKIPERSGNKNRTFQNKKSNVRFSKNERSIFLKLTLKNFFRRIVIFSAQNFFRL